MNAKQVFVAGGMPTVTYVERIALGLERRLTSEIREGYKVITVTGPTQSGKTVLTRHVLGRRRSAVVNGGHVNSSSDFWTLLLQALDLDVIDPAPDRSGSDGGTRRDKPARAQTGRVAGPPDTRRFKTSILKFMRAGDIALIVDDFHHLPMEVQLEIGRALKSEVFEGLVAVLVAVPRRTFDAIGMEREMEGRFAHVEIPPWEAPELVEIPHRGFPALNMRVDARTVRRFVDEARGNPLLVQRFCGRLCDHFDIEAALPAERSLQPSDADLDRIFQAAGTQFRFTDYRKAFRRPPVALNMD